ncbi:MAG: phosphatase PAP2 family protein [Alphaproteobacteria bacterium]
MRTVEPALAPTAWPARRQRQDLIVGLALVTLAALVQTSPFDFWLAHRVYQWEGDGWSLRRAWLLKEVMHDGVNQLVKVMQIGLVLLTIAAFTLRRFAGLPARGVTAWRWPLLYLASAMPACAAIVGLLKAWTNMDCPYDLVGFGGDRPFVGLFEIRPEGLPRGRCFPGGHASGGYGYLGLYFLGRRHGLALPGLLIPLVAGAILGLTQQLRGAHFMSHDLWTLAICWFVCWGLSELMLLGGGRRKA